MNLNQANRFLSLKLGVITLAMFGFGFALVPLYEAICQATGVNVLALVERQFFSGETVTATQERPKNTQINWNRTISVELDTNTRGPWHFKPEVRQIQAHPGQVLTVMYQFQNTQNRTMTAQAIPSYAPKQAEKYFIKLDCFCFQQYTLQAGETKRWPVTFYIEDKLPQDVKTITLSYTFFELGGK